MKKDTYIISYIYGGSRAIETTNVVNAVILAWAFAIEQDFDRTIESVERVSDGQFWQREELAELIIKN